MKVLAGMSITKPEYQAIKSCDHTHVVVVALANKMAQTIWAMLAHGRAYQRDWVSIKPV